MKGVTKWEQAWRAFDADIQAANDFASLTANDSERNGVKKLFNEIAAEFDVPTTSISSDLDNAGDYERAWRRLGAWIYRNDPDIREASDRYTEIIGELRLEDETWNEL